MEKLSLLTINPTVDHHRKRVKALKFLLLAFAACMSIVGYAQVAVTPATGGTVICAATAVSASGGPCTPLGPITVAESGSTADFSTGTDQLVLAPPAGWQFCTTTPTITYSPVGGDIASTPTVSITTGLLTINFNVTNTIRVDQFTINGLQVQPTTPGAASGYIYASSETGIAGITTGATGTNFGNLGIALTAATTYTVSGGGAYCSGGSGLFVNLNGSQVGLSYQLYRGATLVTTLTGTGGALAFGPLTATSTYTVQATNGCGYSATMAGSATITASGASIAPITEVGGGAIINLCSTQLDSEYITDATTGGLWNSTGVTVSTGGKVRANYPGVFTITYSLPATGCFTSVQITVNPTPGSILGPDSVCAGSSTTLSDSLIGGVWTSSNAAIASINNYSGVVTGGSVSVTSFDTIVYTTTGGCSADTVIRVNPVPSLITGDSLVCQGGSTILASAPPGGMWISGNTAIASVTSIGGGEVLVVGGVVGSSPMSTPILYTLPTTCVSLTSVTVEPLPAPVDGPTAVCVGDSITVTDATSGGSWSASNSTVATIDAFGNVTGLSAGYDTVYYTLPTGHCSGPGFVITVHPLPAPIVGPGAVCVGSTATFTDLTPDGNWSVSNGNAFISSAGLLLGIVPGVDTITWTLPTGCITTTTVTINGLPGPIISTSGANNICQGTSTGLTLALYDTTAGGTWSVSNTSVATVEGVTVDTAYILGEEQGVIAVVYTLATSCAQSFIMTVNPTPPVPSPADTSVCQLSSVAFVDAETGGTWLSENPAVVTIDTVTGVAFAASGGTDIITYTGVGGCTNYTNISVLSPDTILAPVTTVCQGSTITLSLQASLPGGWNSTNTSVATVSGGTVEGLSEGTADICFAVSPIGCSYCVPVTVNPITPLAGGPSGNALCEYGSFTLIDGYGPGTYTSSNTTVATVNDTGGVYAAGPGADTITYTITSSGCAMSYTFTVNSTPDAISGIDSVCVGNTITLSNDTAGGIWIPNPTSVATVVTGPSSFTTLTGVAGGVATITYMLPDACYSTVQVTVDPSSAIYSVGGVSAICVLDSTQLIDTTASGVWGSSNPLIASVSVTGMVTGIAPGVDTITYFTPVGGCEQTYAITVNPLPAPITGPDSLCVLSFTNLADASDTGVWSSGNTLIATVGSAGTVYGVSAGTDLITYTLPLTGCLVSQMVTVDPLPTGIYGTDTFMCAGDSIVLHDTTAGGNWMSSNTSVAVVSDSGHVYGLMVGTAIISYVLETGGCPAELVVTVHPIPNITITSHLPIPIFICKGGSDSLTASGADTEGVGSYVWSPAYALSSVTDSTTIASPTVTTTYEVIGTTQWGCRDSAFITVTVDSMLNHLKIVGTDSLCEGLCDTLKASGNPEAQFSWHPTAGLSVTVGDTVVACPTSTTTYEAVAIDASGCVDSVSFTVTVNPIPEIIITQPALPVIVCQGKPTQIIVSTTNTNNNTTTYAWSPNILISCDTCSNPYVSDTFNLVYKVIGISAYGCYDSLNVPVSVLDTNVNTLSTDTNICIGDSVQLIATSHSVTSNLDVPTYYWTPSTGLNATVINDPIANPTSTTTYYVYIHENACFTQEDSVTVFVQPLPDIQITPASPVTITSGTPTVLTATAANVTVQSYFWQPDYAINCDTCYNPTVAPTVPSTTYTVTVTSIYGCVSTDSITVLTACNNNQIFIPNTFTPNGDGVNDRFYVSGDGISEIINFEVYNRWGQQVFAAHNIQANDPGAGWDGTFKGLVLEPDVFIYVVDAQCSLGGKFHKQGDISLVK